MTIFYRGSISTRSKEGEKILDSLDIVPKGPIVNATEDTIWKVFHGCELNEEQMNKLRPHWGLLTWYLQKVKVEEK